MTNAIYNAKKNECKILFLKQKTKVKNKKPVAVVPLPKNRI